MTSGRSTRSCALAAPSSASPVTHPRACLLTTTCISIVLRLALRRGASWYSSEYETQHSGSAVYLVLWAHGRTEMRQVLARHTAVRYLPTRCPVLTKRVWCYQALAIRSGRASLPQFRS
eukprot:747992-Rhodomonas_salina.2